MNYPQTRHVGQCLIPPEWYALTLAEYLESCANDQADLIARHYDNVADVELDDAVERMSEEVDEFKEKYSQLLIASAPTYGIDLNNVDRSTEQFEQFAKEVYDQGVADGTLVTPWYSSLTVDERAQYSVSPYDTIISVTTEDIIGVSARFWNVIDQKTLPTYTDNSRDAIIPIGNGFASCRELRSIALAQVQIGTPSVDLSSRLHLYTGQGNLIPFLQWTEDVAATVNPDGISEKLNGSMASCLTSAGALRAMTLDGVSDRITYFESYISSTVGNARGHISAIIADAAGHVRSASETASDYVDYFLECTGWKGTIDGTISPNESPFNEYTGADPVPSLNLHICKNVVLTFGAAVALVGYGIWQGAKQLWGKVKGWTTKLVDAVFAPQDIGEVDNPLRTHRGITDQWEYEREFNHSFWFNAPDFILSLQTTERDQIMSSVADTISALLSSNAANGTPITMKTWGGEMLVTFDGNQPLFVTANYQGHPGEFLARCSGRVRFKPYCINIKTLYSWIHGSEFRDLILTDPDWYILRPYGYRLLNWSEDKILRFGEYMNLFFTSGDAFVRLSEERAEDNDRLALSGWYCGYAVHQMAISFIATSMEMSQDGACMSAINEINKQLYVWSDSCEALAPVPNPDTVITPVVNKDLVMAATGWTGNTSSVYLGEYFGSLHELSCLSSTAKDTLASIYNREYYRDMGITIETCIQELDEASLLLIAMLLDQRCDREHPDGDWVYLPYSNGGAGFTAPDFVIHTDEHNIQAATIIWAVVGVAVIAVVGRIALKIIARKLTNNKFFKWTQAQGRLDNAMWNGKVLTRKERRTYRKAQRKLSNMATVESLVDEASSATLHDKVQSLEATGSTIVPVVNGVFGTDFTMPSLTANDPQLETVGIGSVYQDLRRILVG